MHRLALAPLLVLASAVPSFAQAPIVVDLAGGGDHTSLQAALDAAPPGATIVVWGGTHPVVRVTKPVTLIADPPASIVGGELSTGFGPKVVLPCIELAGSGGGRVVLSGWQLSGSADGQVATGILAPIAGGGFDELVVLDSTVHAPAWSMLTGTAEGASGIDVDVARTWVERSTVEASDPGTDFPAMFFAHEGPPGIAASGSVVVLDSHVVGGDGMDVPVFVGTPPCPCPGLFDAGSGGPAIAAATVLHAGCTLVGGVGGDVVEWDFGAGRFGLVVGKQPDGAPADAASVRELEGELTVAGELSGGSALDVTVDAGLVPGVLAVSLPTSPWSFGAGPVFVDPTLPPILLPLGATTFALPLPADVGPVGTLLAFQAFGVAPLSVGRPVLRVVVP